MSRIEKTFQRLKSEGRAALIPFITAGYPTPDLLVPLMRALVDAGADVIELGVPFSDPMADGPTIQRASERALAEGMTLRKVLQEVSRFRAADDQTPVVLMGYANPIEAMGLDVFADEALRAGVDGVLVVDYPPEEAAAFGAAMKARGMDPIFLIAPTSTPERIAQVAAIASGYIYYVSLAGVTGSAALDVAAVAEHLPSIREKTGLPVGVGFGIRDAATAGRIARFADAVVVGSRIIEEMEKSPAATVCANVQALVAALRRDMDETRK
ncbi:MAG: tryptophan synthase subunit alpha [Azonexus sp.]|jgi:tryptophan synthase alpha chain|nr:tryptophan synthase subunit alpha [Azonexus sp.]